MLSILQTLERITGKRLDFRKIHERNMMTLFHRWSSEYEMDFHLISNLNRGNNNNNNRNKNPPMGVMFIMKFMMDRGAPYVPVSELMKYAKNYLDTGNYDDVLWISNPEFYTVLREYGGMYREPVSEEALSRVFEGYAKVRSKNPASAGQLRIILDNIVIPRNAVKLFHDAFSWTRQGPIPATNVDYLIARGASRR